MFITVNQLVKVHNHICRLLIDATNNVLDPNQYIGNTILIIGCGDVKVNTADPQTVTMTENSSR